MISKMVIMNKKIIKIIIVIVLIAIIVAILDIPKRIEKIIYKQQYEYYVEKYSERYGVDKNLIYAMIKAESNFEKNSKSSKGAIGVMQLMESTAKEVSKEIDLEILDEDLEKELQNPDTNIKIGAKYISTLIKKYNNIPLAITAYNAGIGTVDKWIEEGIIKADGSDVENIPYKETNNYVRKILRDYKIYQNLY